MVPCPSSIKNEMLYQLLLDPDLIPSSSIIYGSSNSSFTVYLQNDATYVLIHTEHVDDSFHSMTSCDIVWSCNGMIHDVYQNIFHSLLHNTSVFQSFSSNIFIGGHQDAGSLAVLFGIFLYWNQWISTAPKMILSMNSPSIWDEIFVLSYVVPLKGMHPDAYWQVYTTVPSNSFDNWIDYQCIMQ